MNLKNIIAEINYCEEQIKSLTEKVNQYRAAAWEDWQKENPTATTEQRVAVAVELGVETPFTEVPRPMIEKLYLATVTVYTHPYMDGPTYEKVTTLVWAVSPEEAETKVKAKFDNGDPFGINEQVTDVYLAEAIT